MTKKLVLLFAILSLTVMVHSQTFTWVSTPHADSAISRNMPAGKVAVYDVSTNNSYVVTRGYAKGTTLTTIIAAGHTSSVGSSLFTEIDSINYYTSVNLDVQEDSSLHIIDYDAAAGKLLYLDVVYGDVTACYPDSTWVYVVSSTGDHIYTLADSAEYVSEYYQTRVYISPYEANPGTGSQYVYQIDGSTGNVDIRNTLTSDSISNLRQSFTEYIRSQASGGIIQYTGRSGMLGVTAVLLATSYGDIRSVFSVGDEITMVGGTDDGETRIISHGIDFQLGSTLFYITSSLDADDYTGIIHNSYAAAPIQFANDSGVAGTIRMEHDSTLVVSGFNGVNLGVSVTIGADTSETAVVGKMVFQASDSTFYGCRSVVADKKWYKLNP